MTEPESKVDQTYQQASAVALGRTMAEMWRGLIDGGMPAKEALAVIVAYVQALALRPPDAD